MLTGPDLLARFQALDDFLIARQALWRPRPFTQPQLPWESEHPQLARWLRARTLEQADADQSCPERLPAPDPFRELAATAWELGQVGELPEEMREEPPTRLSVDVPGRKWQQIRAFASRLHFHQQPRHWLDWCAGKGHLGRLLAWQGGQPLLCLERDAALNRAGELLGIEVGISSRHVDADVLSEDAWRYLQPQHSVVALHACGQLHMTLLQQAAAHGCAQIAISPCCYNRISTADYQPLSATARKARLQLTRDDLSLPMQESITAGQRTRRQRDQSMAWRLAFDLWQREAQGTDAYLPTPSRPESALRQGIASFCRDLAAHHQLQLREPDSWADLEQQGWHRLAQVRNLELLRGLFRRPLEIWLLLDRALYLQEAGYQVRLGQFCEQQLTPRNLLLVAEKSTQIAPTL